MQLPDRKGFKCGILYLFLQLFLTRKKVKAGKEEVSITKVILRTVSLEKFECGSWACIIGAICRGSEEGGDSKRLYFDLPMELIRSSVTDDANAPVTAAYVFEKDCKGILKKNGSTRSTATATKPDASSGRHIRFSTSCPDSTALCISP
ncbi:hypothetical protein F2P56_007178 [Juglans regia]|uniref:Uncharacterized protein n=2 Tax=Juglans regia TaxID=51240 RepID=A0A833Y3K9_JUGRE|nr:uncharacterized protein LOC108993892 [Juglans regia]KAF5475369.1 hypothetical protein F2P56_007178 [Juglans regia]